MHPSAIPNTILKVLKYPIAICAAVALPYAFAHLMIAPVWSLDFPDYEWFCAGFSGYTIAWWALFRRRFMGSYLSTFEHEFTHAIFAWLTLHRVVGLSVTWRRGGSCTFEGAGGGNWLIAIAPYWFPTLVVPALGLLYVSADQSLPQLHALVGVTTAYHVLSTWTETHSQQPDFQHSGKLFALLFLPTANLMVYGAIVLLTLCGPEATEAYLNGIVVDTLNWFKQLVAH